MTTPTAAADRQRLFGLELDALTMPQVLDRCDTALATRQRLLVGVVNAAKVVNLHKDPLLRDSLLEADVLLADGQSVVWASRLLRHPLPERVAGIDLFERLVGAAARDGSSVYFLGATDEVVQAAVGVMTERHPGLRVAGARDGYWQDDQEVVSAVRAARPDYLFLAIPSPRKEFWLKEHMPALGVPFAMGVGGSFDVIAGKIKRAPVWVQKIGCEWVYRLAQEPRRMWKRYLVGNSRFIWLTMKEMVRSR
jgi:N-acetylglucosaminyldiphosphoundecaprenol N-acetyl-beta-D-mannosaminyltransferase